MKNRTSKECVGRLGDNMCCWLPGLEIENWRNWANWCFARFVTVGRAPGIAKSVRVRSWSSLVIPRLANQFRNKPKPQHPWKACSTMICQIFWRGFWGFPKVLYEAKNCCRPKNEGVETWWPAEATDCLDVFGESMHGKFTNACLPMLGVATAMRVP